MEISNSNLDALADWAADEVRERRDAGECVFVAKIARAYRVDRKRVSRRLKRVRGCTSRKGVNYKLSEIQKAALIQYIRTLDGIGTGVCQEQVVSTANSILRQDYTGDSKPPVVSEHWSHRFSLQHSELHKMRQKPIELARKAAYDPVLIAD